VAEEVVVAEAAEGVVAVEEVEEVVGAAVEEAAGPS
jgi:hypothetical protein